MCSWNSRSNGAASSALVSLPRAIDLEMAGRHRSITAEPSRRLRPVKRSPLDAAHRAWGRRWCPSVVGRLPLSYGDGTLAEHRPAAPGPSPSTAATSAPCGWMGAGAFHALQAALTNDLRKIEQGRAQYTHLLARPTGRCSTTSSCGGSAIAFRRHAERVEHVPGWSRPWRDRRDRRAGRDRGVQWARRPQRIEGIAPEAAAVPRFGVTNVLVGRHAVTAARPAHGLHRRGRRRVQRPVGCHRVYGTTDRRRGGEPAAWRQGHVRLERACR